MHYASCALAQIRIQNFHSKSLEISWQVLVTGRVFIHPASVNFSCGSFPSGWLLYTDVTETSKVFVREASMVPVYALLLFGGALTVHHSDGLIRLDGWATFKAPAQIAALVSPP